jgi:hypothetical protein
MNSLHLTPPLRVDSSEVTDDGDGLTFVRRYSHHRRLREEMR